jgi:arylsulfatase A-like enzyme
MIKSKKLYIVLFLLLAFTVLNKTVAQQNQNSQRPNIILIVADDLGYGDLGCYGQQKIETPNIDRMARAGMKFTQFYAGTAVCAPSRAALMTGLHTGHTLIRGNKGVKPEGQFPLPDTTVTIAKVLEQNGYTTAAFGKWGLGFPGSTGEPLKQGFQNFYGYNCQTLAHNYYPDHLWKNNTRIELSGNLTSDSIYSADLIQQQALQFLKEQGAKPFFLFLPYTLPHASLYGPHDSIYNHYVQKFKEPETSVSPEAKKTDYKWDAHPHAAYAAMVTRLDYYVGDIMKTLQQKGLTDNTLIIFTSDNGPHHEGGGDPDFFNSSGPLNGIKRDLYEGGIRVGCLLLQCGKEKSNRGL